MKTSFLLFSCCLLLLGCSTVAVPNISAIAPCQIHSNVQVEQAILSALDTQNWQMLSFSIHWMKAKRKVGAMEAIVDIAYGYRGFSIEYDYSRHLDYDPELETINRLYVTWVEDLMAEIQRVLKREVELSPSTSCRYARV